MPIKMPKGFARRKSTGSALDDFDEKENTVLRQTPEPIPKPATEQGSFRVIPRTEVDRPVSQFIAPRKPKVEKASTWLSFGSSGPKGKEIDDESSPNNRGSNGSSAANSALSKVYDTSSSSARLSSSSTLPSQHDDELFPRTNIHHTLPAKLPAASHGSEHKSFIQSARTWTLGGKSKPQPSTPIPPLPEQTSPREARVSNGTRDGTRDRAVTSSSYASTTIPPKLEDSLPSTDFGSDLSDMFATLTKRKSGILPDEPHAPSSPNNAIRSESEPILPAQARLLSPNRAANTPSPLNYDRRSHDIASSPRSYQSHDSHDGLMPRTTSTSPYQESFPYRSNGPASESFLKPDESMAFNKSSRATSRSASNDGRPSSQRSSLSFLPDSGDRDAQIVYNSVRTSRLLGAQDAISGGPDANDDLFGNRSTTKPSPPINHSRPQLRAVQEVNSSQQLPAAPEEDDSLFSTATAAAIKFSDETAYAEVQKEQGKKVMTAAQFERYKKHNTIYPEDNADSDSDNSETYEEVDEAERSKQTAAHRRKQEAQLAVFRQQMKKTTGDQGAPTRPISQFRPSLDRMSLSSPNLSGPAFLSRPADHGNVGGPSPPDGSLSDEEDDDVPLAIGMAHGFPHKNRPPSKMIGSGSSIVGVPTDRRGSQMPLQRPSSAAGHQSNSGGNRTSTLPVFARNLPADPFGANGGGANRGAPSVAGGRMSTYDPNATLPGYQPGGLVGVIDSEERARALRRGSPNAQMNAAMGVGGQQALPANMPQQMMGMPPNMPGMNPMMNPMNNQMMSQMMANPNTSQAQMQMFIDAMNRSNEMMAMMMATMQQNQAMGAQPGVGNPPPNQSAYLSPHMNHSNPNLNRPHSMASNLPAQHQPPQQSNPYARTMSMVNPPAWNQPGNRQSSAASFSTSFLPNVRNQPYASSIAPSERSTMGMASRYRPVSALPPTNFSTPLPDLDLPRMRTSTLLPMDAHSHGTPTPPLDTQHLAAPLPPPHANGTVQPRKSGVFATIRALGTKGSKKEKGAVTVVEEEDEEGWGDVRRRKGRRGRSRSPEKGGAGSEVPEELRGLYMAEM
ncbi:hypothetical protein P152DRAFT_189358 [Eremomyces bilateralis CBS 781.70]|uniref:Uncharacterized protein n=1 Tax=Eremomyces bilateralis CBS 781.70 TaxID=1392243 RepID=A0A6G1GC21_9PEZI|nr:uncharacterized protein P152DRAFT_189358 [Eremomyces bilateralis CBS 781.70]KAF1815574.1 hypothetical protein P152DRAFT_189358 [Eremomyces bilateralis CBS 781.70]